MGNCERLAMRPQVRERLTRVISGRKGVTQGNRLSLWWKWVGVNSLAEMMGLGGSVIIALLVIQAMGETVAGTLVAAMVLILAGAFLEGTLVGALQWSILRRPLPALRWQDWVKVTTLGAGIAWLLGMIPSTLMSLQAGAVTEAATMDDPSMFLMISLGLLLGLALSLFLSVPQWWILRHHVDAAGWWIPANALAWMAGMAIIFVAAGSAPSERLTTSTVLFILSMLALAGAIVGAIHGWVLVRLIERTEQRKLLVAV